MCLPAIWVRVRLRLPGRQVARGQSHALQAQALLVPRSYGSTCVVVLPFAVNAMCEKSE